jgi:hypothetical protein
MATRLPASQRSEGLTSLIAGRLSSDERILMVSDWNSVSFSRLIQATTNGSKPSLRDHGKFAHLLIIVLTFLQ